MRPSLLLALAGLMLGVPRAGAQDAEALRATRRALADSVRASSARVEAAERQAQTVADTSVEIAGVTVAFNARALPPRELRRIATGIEEAAAQLEQRFGPDGAALLADDDWTIVSPVGLPVLRVDAGRDDRFAPSYQSEFPVDPSGVRRLAFARAAQRALASNDLIRRYVGGSFSLAPGERTHYFTLRTLATAGSGPARRCARGVLPECRRVLDPDDSAGWYDDGDLLPGTFRAPIAGPVRASLVRFAIETGGPDALRRLRAAVPARRGALDVTADIAGVPTDTLIARWHAHLVGEGRVRADVPLPFVATTLAWAGVLMVLAGRRRGS